MFIIAVGRVLKAASKENVFGVSYLYQVIGGAFIFLFSLIGAVLTDYAGITASSTAFALIAISLSVLIRYGVLESRQPA